MQCLDTLFTENLEKLHNQIFRSTGIRKRIVALTKGVIEIYQLLRIMKNSYGVKIGYKG